MFYWLRKKMKEKGAQMTVEYSVMFVIIVAVILVASKEFVKPALNRLFNSTAKIIDNAANELDNRF